MNPTAIKGIVIRAPYCFEIADGTKKIEYRSWPTKHRGPLAICAAKRKDSGFVSGCAFCVVELVDCRKVGEKDYEWDLANPRMIYPQPVAGRLGMMDLDIPISYDVEYTYAD